MLKFRNYRPNADELGDLALPAKTAPSLTVVKDIDNILEEEIKRKPEVLNVAPQKPNADLKRDVDKKLRKLARRTQKAIRELIREKLLAEENGDFHGVTGDKASQLD